MRILRAKLKVNVILSAMAVIALLVLALGTMGLLNANQKNKTYADSPDIWDGSIATAFAGGTGTSVDPYQISNGSELAYLAALINGTDPIVGTDNSAYNANDVYYKLTDNIYLNDTTDWETWSSTIAPANSWTPIGNSTNNFTANFDGNNKVVSGIYISTTDDYQGLFGYSGAYNHGNIFCNMGVEKSYIQGGKYVGGIVGHMYYGGVINCYNTGNITGACYVGGIVGDARYFTEIANCYNTGTVTFTGGSIYISGIGYTDAYYGFAGGLLGSAGGDNGRAVINCYNAGTVTGAGWFVGGVVGHITGTTIINCYNIGDVTSTLSNVGGVVGISPNGSTQVSKIINCYNTGNITGDVNVGGVEGCSGNDNITNCYNTGVVEGNKNVGGIVGQVVFSAGFNNVVISNCYNSGTIFGSDFGGVVGYITYYVGMTGNVTIDNCYWLNTVTKGVGTGAFDGTITAFDSNGNLIDSVDGNTILLDALNAWVENPTVLPPVIRWATEPFTFAGSFMSANYSHWIDSITYPIFQEWVITFNLNYGETLWNRKLYKWRNYMLQD